VLIVGLSAGPAWSAPAGAKPLATLTIKIEDVLPAGGVLRLGVYDRALYPTTIPPAGGRRCPAIPGETVITLHDLPPGFMRSRPLRTSTPTTKWTPPGSACRWSLWLSLDAVPFLSKPSFDAVKFTLVAGENIQIIHLQNLSKSSPADRARDTLRARQRQ